MADPIKLEPDEIDFWKTVYLRQVDFLIGEHAKWWASLKYAFSNPASAADVADEAIRDLRERRHG